MNFLLHRHLATEALASSGAGVGAMLPDLWRLVDVGSLNGITAAGVRLTPNRAHICAAREPLLIGKVHVLFLQPDAFFAYLDARP